MPSHKKFLPPIHPNSKFKIIWEIYVLIITIITTIYTPLRVVFTTMNPIAVLLCDTVGTFTFIIDIIIQFNTGIMIRHKLITDRKSIAIHYMKNLFVLDILAAIPFPWIFTYRKISSVTKIFKYFLLFKLFKLFSIARTLNRIRKTNLVKPAFMRFILLVFWILIAAHIIACGWILIDGPRKYNAEDAFSSNTAYLEAFYWTITTLTTIGYGDITPINPTQFIYVIIVMLMGAAFYGFIIGNIANIIAKLDVAKSQFREKVENIDTFLKYRNIPGSLQKRIADYYDYLWETRRGYEESNLLHDLPTSLKTQVSFFLNQDIIEKVPIFHSASREFIREIVLNLKPVIYTPGDSIITFGEVGTKMYFISRGAVDIMNGDGSITYATLRSGQYFGEIALLLSTTRTATVMAKVYCDLYVLDKDTFDNILKRYPDFAKNVEEQAKDNRRKLGLTEDSV